MELEFRRAAQRGEPSVLRLAHGLDTAHPVHVAMERMAEIVAERSSGELTIEVEGRDPIVLGPHQGVTIPRGVRHRPRSPDQRTMVLMIETATVTPTGD